MCLPLVGLRFSILHYDSHGPARGSRWMSPSDDKATFCTPPRSQSSPNSDRSSFLFSKIRVVLVNVRGRKMPQNKYLPKSQVIFNPCGPSNKAKKTAGNVWIRYPASFQVLIKVSQLFPVPSMHGMDRAPIN